MPSGEYDDNIKAPTYAGSTPEQRKGLTKWLNLMTGQLELTTKCEEQALLGWQLWWGVAHYISDRCPDKPKYDAVELDANFLYDWQMGSKAAYRRIKQRLRDEALDDAVAYELEINEKHAAWSKLGRELYSFNKLDDAYDILFTGSP